MIQVVSGVMNDWRVNRCWFDQGYPNWSLFLQQLHSERLGEAFDRVFAGAVHPLKRQGDIGSYTADVDGFTEAIRCPKS